MAGLVGLAWLASEDRRGVPWRAVGAGVALMLGLAVLFLKVDFIRQAFLTLNDALLVLERATQAGTGLVFGYLGGAPAPFQVSAPEATFILAFRALPLVLVISALSALLFYWGVLPAVVRAISWLLRRSMGVGGVVGLSTAANVFVGMVEAPLFVKPYLGRVSRGELFAIMVGGMASIAGTVLFLYAAILGPVLPGAARRRRDSPRSRICSSLRSFQRRPRSRSPSSWCRRAARPRAGSSTCAPRRPAAWTP